MRQGSHQTKLLLRKGNEMANERQILVDVLTAMGVEVSDKVSLERLQTKLAKRIERKGVPSDLTAEQQSVLTAMGLVAAPEKAGKKGRNKKRIVSVEEYEKELKAEEEEKEKEEKKTDKQTKSKHKTGAAAVFRDLFAKGKRWNKAETISAMQKAGIADATITSYVAWVKQLWKPSNPFGFYLKEITDKEGNVCFVKTEHDPNAPKGRRGQQTAKKADKKAKKQEASAPEKAGKKGKGKKKNKAA